MLTREQICLTLATVGGNFFSTNSLTNFFCGIVFSQFLA
jgi:hypothetical protein